MKNSIHGNYILQGISGQDAHQLIIAYEGKYHWL